MAIGRMYSKSGDTALEPEARTYEERPMHLHRFLRAGILWYAD